jgi:fructose-1,6-bisphosphatase I
LTQSKKYLVILDIQLVRIYKIIKLFIVNRLGTKNEFGDERIDMDVQTDSLINDNLKKSKVVHMVLSEERPYPTIMNKKGDHIVTFDPIDGGNLIDSNYTVGSIFGVWPKG